ncbi:quinone-interacting membrane-bound oxidoreductase complex subunit QmoC [Chloroflexota bacterium]
MEDRYLIEPDTKFIKEVNEQAGGTLKKCFQCSTCTVICNLSPEERPFPRKEMIWAQWGLKERLVKDPDIWLCHQCTDCSTNCPRDAKPAEVLAAIRNYAIGHFSRPAFLAKAVSSPRYLPVILAIPAILLFLFFWITENLQFPAGIISPEDMFRSSYTYGAMTVILVFMIVVSLSGAYRFWKGFNQFGVDTGIATGSRDNWMKALWAVIVDIIKHSKFGKCGENKLSRYTHLIIFYGAILLLISTALSATLHHLVHIYSPHILLGPVKIAGNLGALLFLTGLIIVICRRLSTNSNLSNSAYFDWFLIWILLLTNLTGVATEVIRLAGLAVATYVVYLLHLWLMFVFFIYLPFSKAAHMFYRIVALTYTRQIGREAQ